MPARSEPAAQSRSPSPGGNYGSSLGTDIASPCPSWNGQTDARARTILLPVGRDDYIAYEVSDPHGHDTGWNPRAR